MDIGTIREVVHIPIPEAQPAGEVEPIALGPADTEQSVKDVLDAASRTDETLVLRLAEEAR